MTPQLHIKLQNQVQRQGLELTQVQASLLALVPDISPKEQALAEIKSRLETTQTELSALQQVEGSDTSVLTQAIQDIQAEVQAAESVLNPLLSERSSLQAKADALQAGIASCQAELSASNLTEDNIVAYQQELLTEANNKQEQQRIASLWQAAHDIEFAAISGVAVGLLVLGVMQQKPISVAISNWVQSLWTEYYVRKFSGSTDTDFSSVGDCPHSIPEMMQELGM